MISFALGLFVGWQTAGMGHKGTDLRIWDVAVLGPALLLLAYQVGPPTNLQRIGLAFTAGATIGHNGRNLLVSCGQQ